MISINLLPPELQRAAKTPRALFFSIIGGVAAAMVVGSGVLWLWMSVRSLERQVESRAIQVRALEEESREVDRLNEDIEFYKDREKAIIEIKSRRTFWGLKLHQLMKSVPDGVWVTRLSLDTLDESEYKWDRTNPSEMAGGELTLNCFVRGTDVGTLTNFRSALRGDDKFYASLIEDDSVFPDNFFGTFLGFAPLELERVELDGYAEPSCLYSTVKLELKPRFEPPAAAVAKKGK